MSVVRLTPPPRYREAVERLRMLEVLGVGAFDETVYRALVSQQTLSRAEIAATLDSAPQLVDDAISRLHAVGLVGLDGDLVRATDPRITLSQRVKERLDEVNGAWARVEELASLYATAELRAGSARLTTVIDGSDSLTQWFNNLVASAREEIRLIDAPPHASRVAVVPSEEHRRIGQGVAFRVLYAVSRFDIPGTLDQVLADVAAGEQARVLPTVPFKLLIVDAACALLPMSISTKATGDSVIVVHPSGLLDALVHHFELLWSQARPVGLGLDGDLAATADRPTDDELALLRLLDAGLTDEAVSRQLGISGRTFRRRLAALQVRLHAGSRFQAGARARERGWI